MANSKKWLWRLGALVVVVALVFLALRETPVPVQTARVGNSLLETVVEEEGRTRARDRYLVASPVAGTVERIRFEEGDAVAAGDVLARVFPAEQDPRVLTVARAELTAAEARLAAAETAATEAHANAEQANREFERRRGLLDLGAISQENLERARLAATTAVQAATAADAALRAGRAEVDAARARAEPGGGAGGRPIELRAPTAGSVLRVFEESERAVSPGTPLVELADVTGLEIVVDVLSEDAVTIQVGDPIRIRDWGGGGTLDGVVRLVHRNAYTRVSALGVEEQRVDIVGDLHTTPGSFGAGYRFVAEIITSAEETLTVPNSALFRVGEGWRVFRLDAGRVSSTPVELGRRGGDASEVLSGLGEGDEVVLFPSDQLEDGSLAQASEAA